MRKLPPIISESNHFAAAVARTPNQPAIVERVHRFLTIDGIVAILRGMAGSLFCWWPHCFSNTLLSCLGIAFRQFDGKRMKVGVSILRRQLCVKVALNLVYMVYDFVRG